MKTAPGPLVAHINGSNVFFMADLYDFLLVDGTRLRYCTEDHPVVYPSTLSVIDPPGTFYPLVGITRGQVEWSSKLEVQTLTVTLMVNPSVTYNGVPVTQAACEGIFDLAEMTLYRAFFDASRSLVDALVHYKGTVGDVKPTSTSIEFTVKSELDKLNQKLPRNLYQPGCNHAFLDEGCDPLGTVRAANTTTGALIGTPTKFIVTVPGTYAADNFKLGAIAMTSGDLDGQRRSIRTDVDGGGGHVLTLAVPLPRAPAAGDTFSLIVGCDRTFATCGSRFSNTSHFRGFPFVPRPEEQWR